MRDGNGEFDVTHALATNAAQGYFDAATVADHAAIAYALVFPAMAFPVLYRTENTLAEEAVLLRLERPVVDRFRLENFAPRPPVAQTGHCKPLALLGVLGSADLLGGGDPHLDLIERRRARF